MLRIASGVPGVSATGLAASPATVADTAASAVAGAHSATAATRAAKSFLPESILPPEKVRLRRASLRTGRRLQDPTAKMGLRTYDRPRRSAAPLRPPAPGRQGLVPHGRGRRVRGAA